MKDELPGDRVEEDGDQPHDLAAIAHDLRDLSDLIRTAGEVLAEVANLVTRLCRRPARILRGVARTYWVAAVIAALIGVSSPLTGGWGGGIPPSAWLAWTPIPVLPIIVLAIGGMLSRSGDARRRRGENNARSDATPEPPDIAAGLSRDIWHRNHVNTTIRAIGVRRRLEDQLFVREELDELAYQLAAHGQTGIPISLRRWSHRSGLEEIAVHGALDGAVREGLDEFEWKDVVEFDRSLAATLQPTGHLHTAIAFSAGWDNYVLLAIGTSSLPAQVTAQLSHAATRLVERLASSIKVGNTGALESSAGTSRATASPTPFSAGHEPTELFGKSLI